MIIIIIYESAWFCACNQKCMHTTIILNPPITYCIENSATDSNVDPFALLLDRPQFVHHISKPIKQNQPIATIVAANNMHLSSFATRPLNRSKRSSQTTFDRCINSPPLATVVAAPTQSSAKSPPTVVRVSSKCMHPMPCTLLAPKSPIVESFPASTRSVPLAFSRRTSSIRYVQLNALPPTLSRCS